MADDCRAVEAMDELRAIVRLSSPDTARTSPWMSTMPSTIIKSFNVVVSVVGPRDAALVSLALAIARPRPAGLLRGPLLSLAKQQNYIYYY